MVITESREPLLVLGDRDVPMTSVADVMMAL